MSFATLDHLAEADYVGLVSGSEKPDKIAAAGLHPVKGQAVDAPLFEEYPLALECRVIEMAPGPGGIRVVGEVVNVSDIGFYPQPVLVIGTYDENGTPNAMNVGWGGMVGGGGAGGAHGGPSCISK